MTKVFTVLKHPNALFTGCVLQMADSVSLITRVLFNFKKTHKTRHTSVKVLYFTSNISHGIRLQEEQKSLKKFQKIILALDITKLTLKGEKREPMCASLLPLPYRKSKK